MTLPLVLSGVAVLLSLIAAVFAWGRGRRPAPAVEPADSPTREDVNV